MTQERKKAPQKQKTKVLKYKNVHYPPYESPIIVENDDAPEDIELPEGAFIEGAEKRVRKKRPIVDAEDPDDIEIEYDDTYNYKNPVSEYTAPIIIGALIIIIAIFIFFLSTRIWPAIVQIEQQNKGKVEMVASVANTEALVALNTTSVDPQLEDYKNALLALRGDLYDLLVYNGIESINATKIVENGSLTELTPNKDILVTLDINMVNDLATKNTNTVLTHKAEPYIFGFIKNDAARSDVEQLTQQAEQLVLPDSIASDTLGYQTLVDATAQLILQTKLIAQKQVLESNINQYFDTPIIASDRLNIDDVAFLSIPSDADLEGIEKAIRSIDSESTSQTIVVAAYELSLKTMKNQINKIQGIEESLTVETEKPNQRNIVDIKKKIDKLPDGSVKSTLTDQWQTLQNKLDEQKASDAEAKELAEQQENTKKDAQKEIERIKESTQQEIDRLNEAHAEQTKQLESTITQNYQSQIDSLRDELNTRLSENDTLKQQNDLLMQQIQDLQKQVDQTTNQQGVE